MQRSPTPADTAAAPAEEPIATVRGLIKRYGATRVIDGIDLEVRAGECLALLGPNGAGKTTTLRVLLGLSPPSAGVIHVLGHRIPECARAMRLQVGIVPQLDNLDPDFSVSENLIAYGRFFGLPAAKVRERLGHLLGFAELGNRGEAPIQSLSGGMRRRLTLARALVNDPRLLVLDEPTTGLDPQARQHIWQRLHELQRDGRTLLLTTHYMEEAERLCDRAAVIDAGRIVACDTPATLIRTHIEAHVVELRGRVAKQWRENGASVGAREEHVGETVFLYSHEREPMLGAVHEAIGERYLYRPANLEDVFLRLTGRDLRD